MLVLQKRIPQRLIKKAALTAKVNGKTGNSLKTRKACGEKNGFSKGSLTYSYSGVPESASQAYFFSFQSLIFQKVSFRKKLIE